MFSARNSRTPGATRCCRCGGHVGNISVLGALHMALSSWDAWIKVNMSQHTSSSRMTEMERTSRPTVPNWRVWQVSMFTAPSGVALQSWMFCEYYRSGVRLLYKWQQRCIKKHTWHGNLAHKYWNVSIYCAGNLNHDKEKILNIYN